MWRRPPTGNDLGNTVCRTTRIRMSAVNKKYTHKHNKNNCLNPQIAKLFQKPTYPDYLQKMLRFELNKLELTRSHLQIEVLYARFWVMYWLFTGYSRDSSLPVSQTGYCSMLIPQWSYAAWLFLASYAAVFIVAPPFPPLWGEWGATIKTAA